MDFEVTRKKLRSACAVHFFWSRLDYSARPMYRSTPKMRVRGVCDSNRRPTIDSSGCRSHDSNHRVLYFYMSPVISSSLKVSRLAGRVKSSSINYGFNSIEPQVRMFHTAYREALVTSLLHSLSVSKGAHAADRRPRMYETAFHKGSHPE